MTALYIIAALAAATAIVVFVMGCFYIAALVERDAFDPAQNTSDMDSQGAGLFDHERGSK